jgi:hypothetical protein
VDMCSYRCEQHYCCGEAMDGEPAFMTWEWKGLNTFSPYDLLDRQISVKPALFDGRKDAITTIQEELTALGYSVEYDSYGSKQLRILAPL